MQHTARQVQEGKLAEDQIKELENLGFELLSFKEEGGHCNVRGVHKGGGVGRWVVVQRTLNKAGRLANFERCSTRWRQEPNPPNRETRHRREENPDGVVVVADDDMAAAFKILAHHQPTAPAALTFAIPPPRPITTTAITAPRPIKAVKEGIIATAVGEEGSVI